MAEDNEFFLTAQKLNRLERRKAEIEKEIDDCRTILAAMDIGSEPRVAYDFGDFGRVTVSSGRYWLGRDSRINKILSRVFEQFFSKLKEEFRVMKNF